MNELEKYDNIINEDIIPLLKEIGCIAPDIELIGLALYNKYKGEFEKFEKLKSNTLKVIQEADEFLKKLQNNG